MSDRKAYSMNRWGNLLLSRASLKQQQEIRVIQLLVDTGSSFTVLPRQVLLDIGCPFPQSGQTVSVIAAGGVINAPKLVVAQFSCLGCTLENFSVVALDLPTRSPAAGLLGMDFLTQVGAIIDTRKSKITFS
jgi:aspartyl protease family protein